MPFQYKVSEDKKVRVIIYKDAACEGDDPLALDVYQNRSGTQIDTDIFAK